MLAIFAYILLYLSIPEVSIERTLHLQFECVAPSSKLLCLQVLSFVADYLDTCSDGINPYGFVSLGAFLVAQQAYDIKLELDLPRSPPNLEAGNFMLEMALLSPAYTPSSQSADTPFDIHGPSTNEAVVFSSRRPAILTYHSRLINLSKQVFGLPWYLLGWRDAEQLEIVMAEGVSFKKGWRNVPTVAYVEVQGRGQSLQVYDVQLKLRARYEGLRWLMYSHRIFSLIVFTTAFWAAEVLFAVLSWVLWSTRSGVWTEEGAKEVKGEETDESTAIKTEEGGVETDLDMSDTPRSFPTYGRQAPLQYIPKIKKEEETDQMLPEETTIQPFAAEADDESEEPPDVGSFRGGRSDSGIGTSFSDGGGSLRGGVQRRRSKGSRPR